MKYYVFEDHIASIMSDEDARSNWEEKLGLKLKLQATHKSPVISVFEVVDEKKAIKYANHSKVKVMDKNAVKAYVENLFADYPEYVLTDSMALYADMILSKKTEIEGYNPNKPITCQENLKVLHDVGLGGIIKRKKPTIE